MTPDTLLAADLAVARLGLDKLSSGVKTMERVDAAPGEGRRELQLGMGVIRRGHLWASLHAARSAEADLQKARVQLETARAQVARYTSLTTDQMVSKEQFEKISDTARSLESEVQSDESRLATAKLQLEYCSIRAPACASSISRGRRNIRRPTRRRHCPIFSASR